MSGYSPGRASAGLRAGRRGSAVSPRGRRSLPAPDAVRTAGPVASLLADRRRSRLGRFEFSLATGVELGLRVGVGASRPLLVRGLQPPGIAGKNPTAVGLPFRSKAPALSERVHRPGDGSAGFSGCLPQRGPSRRLVSASAGCLALWRPLYRIATFAAQVPTDPS